MAPAVHHFENGNMAFPLPRCSMRVYGLILALLSLSAQAQAGTTSERLQAYQKAADKLRVEIGELVPGTNKEYSGGFMALVKKCNPPFQDKMFKGFADPANPESAQAALARSSAAVQKLVADSEKELAGAVKSCSASGVETAAGLAKTELSKELALYKSNVDKAKNDNQKTLMLALGMREKSPTVVEKTVGAGEVAACAEAVKQLDAVDASNGALQARLGELAASFDDRLALATASVNRCAASAPAKGEKASFREDDEPLLERAEGGGTTAI